MTMIAIAFLTKEKLHTSPLLVRKLSFALLVLVILTIGTDESAFKLRNSFHQQARCDAICTKRLFKQSRVHAVLAKLCNNIRKGIMHLQWIGYGPYHLVFQGSCSSIPKEFFLPSEVK